MININGLTTEEVQKRINEGKSNNSNTDNLKSNWQIIKDNVFTLFNLFNFFYNYTRLFFVFCV